MQGPPAQPQSLADPLADGSKALLAAGCWLLATLQMPRPPRQGTRALRDDIRMKTNAQGGWDGEPETLLEGCLNNWEEAVVPPQGFKVFVWWMVQPPSQAPPGAAKPQRLLATLQMPWAAPVRPLTCSRTSEPPVPMPGTAPSF